MIKRTAFITTIFLIGLWAIGFICFCARINSYQIDEHTHTQAIIALTGGRHRIAQALDLLNRGMADKLFISGVGQDISLEKIARTQKLNINHQDKITLGLKATNTVGNAIETTSWLKENQISSIRLVTSNYHVERSIIEFRTQNPQLQIIAHPVYSERVSKKWWTTWHTFSLIFAEYNKFLYVYIRTLFS